MTTDRESGCGGSFSKWLTKRVNEAENKVDEKQEEQRVRQTRRER